jgi:hypothetical protein
LASRDLIIRVFALRSVENPTSSITFIFIALTQSLFKDKDTGKRRRSKFSLTCSWTFFNVVIYEFSLVIYQFDEAVDCQLTYTVVGINQFHVAYPNALVPLAENLLLVLLLQSYVFLCWQSACYAIDDCSVVG